MDLVNKKLLNVKELKEYTGWGDTTVRRLLRRADSPFTVDKYIADCIKYQINVC